MSSLSCPSEPPDVGNWFSSYEYQSPNLDSNFTLEESSFGKRKSLHKDETKTEIVQPKVCVEHNSSFDVSYGMKKNINTANTSHLEKILQPCMQVKELQYSLGSTKHNETVNRNCGSPGCNGEAHFMSLNTHTSAMRPPNLVQKNGTEEAKSKVEIQAEKLDINTGLSKSFSAGSSACTGNKENDGFVTTRK